MAANITKGTCSVDTATAMKAGQISGLIAGEALDIGAPCYIAADGTVKMCDGTAADIKAKIAGFTARAVAIGEPVTLFGAGTIFRYGSGLTPSDTYYLSATPGALYDVATAGDAVGVARAVTARDRKSVV